ncbi:MAG: hypothetical protein ACP5N7_01255 [Candidatus Pacearchaeota archaeon]
MTNEQDKLIVQTYNLALEGKHITVSYLQEELGIDDPNIAREIIDVLVNYGKIIYVDLEGERFWMDTGKLQPDFGMPNAPEKDEKLIELIVSAKKEETPVYKAVVDINKVKPFCDYKPPKERYEKTREYFKQNIEKFDPPSLHLYQDGEYLIMSDDYNAYYMYLNEGFKKVPCIIFGETDIKEVENKERINYQ